MWGGCLRFGCGDSYLPQLRQIRRWMWGEGFADRVIRIGTNFHGHRRGGGYSGEWVCMIPRGRLTPRGVRSCGDSTPVASDPGEIDSLWCQTPGRFRKFWTIGLRWFRLMEKPKGRKSRWAVPLRVQIFYIVACLCAPNPAFWQVQIWGWDRKDKVVHFYS